MVHLIRDSFFGHLIRLSTNGRVFQYPEELDPSIWQRYINEEKSANLAAYGKTEVDDSDAKDSPRDSGSPTRTLFSENDTSPSQGVGAQHDQHVPLHNGDGSRRQVDAEKGRDVYLVDWYGPDDPEVCL